MKKIFFALLLITAYCFGSQNEQDRAIIARLKQHHAKKPLVIDIPESSIGETKKLRNTVLVRNTLGRFNLLPQPSPLDSKFKQFLNAQPEKHVTGKLEIQSKSGNPQAALDKARACLILSTSPQSPHRFVKTQTIVREELKRRQEEQKKAKLALAKKIAAMEEAEHNFLQQFSSQNQKKTASSVQPQEEDAQWSSGKLSTAGYEQNIW